MNQTTLVPRRRRSRTGFRLLYKTGPGLFALLLAGSLQAASETWTGGDTPNFNWNNATDWSVAVPVMDDQLFFDGSTGLPNTNNLSSNTEFTGLTFNSTAGSFMLSGNQLTLANGAGITNNSALVQTNNLGLGLAVTNNNIVNYITTPGGGKLVIGASFVWATVAVTNDTVIFNNANVQDANSSAASSFGVGGATGCVSNTLVLNNSLMDGIGLRRINTSSGLANTIILNNSVATNIDGIIIGNGGNCTNNTLVVSNHSKIYVSGSDLYEVGRNTGSTGNNILITGAGSAIYSGGHAFAIGGSSGNTTNCGVQVNDGALWNLGGSTFRLNFSGPFMSLSANNGTVSNVYSMIIGNGNYSNSVTLANGSKFNFSAPSGDFREVGRGGNAYNNTLTLTDPNTRWDNGGSTLTVGGTAGGANNFSNIMTIANGAVFTNGSLQIGGGGGGGTYQQLVVSNGTAYISNLYLNGGNSIIYLNGGSGDHLYVNSLGNYAGALLTNTASTAANLVLGWNNGNGLQAPVLCGLMNVTKTGAGSANLQSPSTFTGNVLVTGGTLGTGTQQAAGDGSSSAFGCLTNAGTILTITNGGTLNLGINNALLNGMTPDTLPPITVYAGGTLNASRFNALGQLTLNGGALLQNSSDSSGYQFFTNVTVGGSAAAVISVGTSGAPDNLYDAVDGGTTFNVANTASGGADLTVSAGLADGSDGNPGSLTKTGNGVMVLSGTNTYTGGTTVAGGKLVLYTYSQLTGAITVNDGQTLDVTVAGANQLVNSALILGGGTGATIELVGLNSTTVAPVVVSSLTLNGTATLNLITPTLAVGNQYPLITYTTAGGTGGLVIGAKPRGSTMNLVTNNNGDGTFTVALNVVALPSGPSTDIWSGTQNGNWDVNVSANWIITGSAGTYYDGDYAQFTDASGVTNVTLTATVAPGGTTVNSFKNYTFFASSGSHIAGSGSLTKNGTGTLVLAGLINTYSGTNTINSGTVSISADANLGATTNEVFLIGGALSASSSLTLSANRTLLLGPASGSGTGTLDAATNQTLTFAGVVANNAAGTGSLSKTGPGTVLLTGTNTYTGSTLVSGGILSVTTAQQGGGTFTVNDTAALTVSASGGATFPVSTLTLGNGGSTLLTLQGISGGVAGITATNLIAHGTVTVSVLGAAVQIGEIPLIQYSTLSGSIGNFALAPTLPPNVTAVLTNDTSGKFIGLLITSINGLAWTGATSANWDIATTTNWVFGTTNSIYSDGSAVLFNDTGARNVTLGTLVSPGDMVVSNVTITYTFTPASPSDGIGGPGGLEKFGAGTLNYEGVTNSYSGETVIGSGQIYLAAHPANDGGSALLEFSTNSVIITNNAFLELAGVGGSATVWNQTMSNAIRLNGGNIFATDGGQHLAGPVTIGPNGAAFGDQQINKYLYLDGPVSGTGAISVPLPNGGINDGIHTPGGSGYGGPNFTCSTNSYGGTLSLYNGYVGIQDVNGTALANATLDLEGYNGTFGQPVSWTDNGVNAITLGGLAGANTTLVLNLTEPNDSYNVSLTVGNNSASPVFYHGILSDSDGSDTVTKVGSNAQWLVGANTYAGATMVNGGELGISTLHTGNGTFTVTDGASLGVTNAENSASAQISALNLGVSGATTVEFQNVADPNTPVINCGGGLTVNGISTVLITGTNGLIVGDTYPLIASTGISGAGSFALTLPTGVTGTLTTNGTTLELNVLSLAQPLPTIPTNLTFSVSNGSLKLGWPASYTGYSLQVQTNSLSVGLSTNWVDVPNSTTTNQVVLPINPANGAVFFRLNNTP
jgi:autotransporter-associated beta strand protein